MTRYSYERATSAHADGLLALFASAGSGCYCNYWHFEGDKNAWLERCYLKPEENRAELVARLGAAELCGVVALREDGASSSVCGWMKVLPAARVARLYDQRVYRRLPYFEEQPAELRQRTYTIACTYVADADRGRGVAKWLLEAATAAAKQAGAIALEAFPRGTPEGAKLRTDEVWMGPEELFLGSGFRAVTDFRPYPVLRRDLT